MDGRYVEVFHWEKKNKINEKQIKKIKSPFSAQFAPVRDVNSYSYKVQLVSESRRGLVISPMWTVANIIGPQRVLKKMTVPAFYL